MKQKDISLILVIVVLSAIISFLLSNTLFASPKHRQQQVEVVSSISSNFATPDAKYFNQGSVDLTQLIQIGNTTNPNLFNGSSQ